MRRNMLCVLILTGLFLVLSGPLLAQDKPAAKGSAPAPTPASAPTSGPRAEFLDTLDYFEGRYTKLAEAMPTDKYTWRPGEGVRSVSEVFLHISAANFNLPRLIGTQPPAGLDVRGLEKSTTDKAKVIQTLKDSYAHIRGAVLKLSDADVEKNVKLFGKDVSYHGVFLFISRHSGEHLGQSIAYARVNGVVPPWTEEQQQQQRQQQQKPAEKPKP
jgi:uncharacterized damage-inducible protein DinB